MFFLTHRISAFKFLVIAIFLFFPVKQTYAIGDGPRAYQTLPDGRDMIAVYGVYTEGNTTADPGIIFKGADIDVTLGVLQYTHTFDVRGQQGAIFGVLPFGELEGSVHLASQTVNRSSSGVGDMQIGCVIGLAGSPSLSVEEYKKHQPRFCYGILGKISLPTGEYDEDKALNLSANRWSVQLGLPMAYSIGKSMVDPSLTRFEFLPSLTFYTNNDNPYNAGKYEQDPVLNLEAHAIRNLNMLLWVSLDALYTYGGETTTDGVDDDNKQSAFYLGGTINLTITKTASLKVSYGETVEHNDSGADGSMVRAIVSNMF